jgi:hypothetical protein
MPMKLGRRTSIAGLLSLVGIVLLPLAARAEGIRILGDLEYVNSDTDSENKDTGDERKTNHSRFTQLYDVNVQKQVYPFLDLRAGILFELNDSDTKTDGVRSDFEEDTRRYFGEVNLNNPLHRAGLLYRDTEIDLRTTGQEDSKLFREEVLGRWSWRPVGFPSADLTYQRSHTYDDPETRDSITQFFILQNAYEFREFGFDYTYSRNDIEDEISDSGSLSQVHNGRIGYSNRFLDDRVSIAGGAMLNHRTVELSAGGDVELPVDSPTSVFFLLDDSKPENNAQDEFTTVDAGNPLTTVDIGPDGPRSPVSFGLEFATRTDVDRLHVLPSSDDGDTSLASASEIHDIDPGDFGWQVFSSDDQEEWEEHLNPEVRHLLVENLFEITISPGARARYIKVVARPLPSGRATRKIPISQIRAFTIADVEAGDKLTDFEQNYDFGVGWNISETSSAAYDVYLNVLESKPSSTERTRLTNSVSGRRILSPIFTTNARFLRSDTWESEREHTARNQLAASIRGDYLDTFKQTLSYSGTYDDEEEGWSGTSSIFLRNSADLYRDWSANLDTGFSWRRPTGGGSNTSTTIRLGTSAVPHRRVHLRLDYSIGWVEESNQSSQRDQSLNAQGFWLMLDTLRLFAAVSYRDRETGAADEKPRVSQDYSVSWAPFPDGSVDLSLRYSRSKATEGRDSWTISPELRWQIARGLLLTVTYSIGTVESVTERSDVETWTGRLRIFY